WGALSSVNGQSPFPPIAYTSFYCYCPGPLCQSNTSCPYPDSSSVSTSLGSTGGRFDSSPAWSPDATRIVYVSDGSIVVWGTVNITGGVAPAWSPDGTHIAFASNRDGPPELYVMNPDGSSVVRVTTAIGFTWSRPSWSPDSTRLAFGCEVVPGNADI